MVNEPNNGQKLLLDTQVFIWLIQGSNNLSKELIKSLKNPQNSLFLSVASVWEIIIKKMNGKLKIPQNIESNVKEAGIELVPIEFSHVMGIENLPQLHKDPFDRIILAQAKAENLVLITNDVKMKKYNVKILDK